VKIWEKLTYEEVYEQYKQKGAMQMKRMRQKIVQVLGDYYFQDIPVEEAIRIKRVEESIRCEADINEFCSKMINEKIPLSKSQWELYFVEDYSPTESVIIWKNHHVLGDGISAQAVFVALSDEYNPEALPPIRKVSAIERVLMKVFTILYAPMVFYKMLFTRDRVSPFNNKNALCGVKKCLTSKDFRL